MSTKTQIAVPTLSAKGYVTDVPSQLDELLSYFFTSDYSQTNVHPSNIVSLQYIIFESGNNELQLMSVIQNTLTILFEKYFDGVDVKVSINSTEEEDTYGIVLDATVVKDNIPYNVGKSIGIINSKIAEIVDYLNG